jgi:hypothetical protein
MKLPSPKEHPNAFITLSSGGLTSFLVAEAKSRFGVDLTPEEAGYIVIGVPSAILLLAGKVRGS